MDMFTSYGQIKGATIRFPGGAGVFVAGKLFISTGLGGALKISHFVTCLYGTVIEVNYLFHAESARNYLFQKCSCPPPPPWGSNGGPLRSRNKITDFLMILARASPFKVLDIGRQCICVQIRVFRHIAC